jgi:hypothetical protein
MYFLEKMLVLARGDVGDQHGHSHGHQHQHHHHNDHQVESVNVPDANKNGGEQSDVEQAPRELRQLNNEQLTDEKTNISHIIFMVVLGKYYWKSVDVSKLYLKFGEKQYFQPMDHFKNGFM